MLFKLLPALMMAGGAYKNQDKIKNLLQIVEVISTQTEMSNICKVIKLDSITEEYPSEDPEKFAAYLRQNIKSKDGQGARDYSKDMWGTSYVLVLKGKIATVKSAGPDKKFSSKDDILSSTDMY